MQFAVDAIVIGSHMQRSNYILYVEDVDSNNVLYRNCQEFYDKIRRVMDQMATRLNQSIMISGHKRGLIKNIATVPIIALRAVAAFADCYQFDEGLKKEIEYLVNSLPRPGFGQMQIEEVAALRDSVELHLTKIYASNKEALEFIERVFRQ